jgi:protein transport protein SEC24
MKNRPPIRKYYGDSYYNNNNNNNQTSSQSQSTPPMGNSNQYNRNQNNKTNQSNDSTPPSRQGPRFANPKQGSQYNNQNKDISSNENDTQETAKEQNITPKHKTSQKHKTPESSYNINPSQIPRPNQYDEIYMNNEKLPIYETNIGTAPPHTTSFYSVKETQNSSCRYIRPTLNSVPISQSLLIETNLLFGICVQPFAEIPDYEEVIPKVKTEDNIFRCRQCKSYINNKYNISYSNQNRQIAICNLCHYENELDINNKGIKSEYLSSDYSNCPELTKPTVDFIAPASFKSSKAFVPHYLFMIDISEYSYQLGLPAYIINSIQTNLELIHNAENSYIGFALYDHKNIYFFYVEKEDVRLTIMGDIIDPFCPISLKKLYLKVVEDKEKIEKLVEKLNFFIEEKNKNISESNVKRQTSTITGAAIKAGVESLLENGGRVMVFTPNPCNHGYGACSSNREIFEKEKDPLKSNPFYPQHEKFVEVGEKASNNRIVIDQFIFMSTSFDLSTFSVASTLSGGQIEFYNYSTDQSVVNSNYEKLHYDLTRILTRPNYYDCKFMLRFTVGVDCVEILGPFNKKLGEAFQLGGCDPDYCYFYNMRLNEYFKNGQIVDIQLVVLFDDNYSNRYLRIFNYSFEISSEVGKIFTNAEVDSISKAMIYKEISLIYRTDFKSVRNNLENKIINSFKYYRVKKKSSAPSNQLILPVSIRYLPLYVDSFLKTGILSNQNKPEMLNLLIYIMNKLLRDPIYSTTKFLYPKFYRIDNIEGEQTINGMTINNIGLINEKYNIIQKPVLLRLSKDLIDFDCAYLIDNGCYIYLFIFNQIEGQFYKDLFGVETFEEANNLEISNLDEENQSDLNQRLLNIISQLRKENNGYVQPIRLFFFEEKGINNPILVNLLKEDKIDEYDNYPAYLCNLHKEIQERIDE